MIETETVAEVVNLQKVRLEGRDHDDLLLVIRTLERLGLAGGAPLMLDRNGERWMLLFGRVES